MKTWLTVLSALILSVNLAVATPVRIVDGTPQFAISQVSGFPAWTQAEQDNLVATYGGGSIVLLAPANYEVNLSTTLMVTIDGFLEVRFASYDEWISCQTRAGLKRKVRRIREMIDSMSDLPASESLELRQRAGWLRAYYLSLP